MSQLPEATQCITTATWSSMYLEISPKKHAAMILTPPNAMLVHVLVRLCVRELTCINNHLVRTWHTLDARKLLEGWEQRGPSESDCLSDDLWRCNVELCHHHSTNVVSRGWDEFGYRRQTCYDLY
jgi:hypothetical protein